MGTCRRIDDIVAALKEKAARTPPGQWIVGSGYDDTGLAERRHPTRLDLDRASSKHPIWLLHVSYHLGVANSAALARAGVTGDTPQPDGGVIRVDGDTPLGVFEEPPAMALVQAHVPAPTLGACPSNHHDLR